MVNLINNESKRISHQLIDDSDINEIIFKNTKLISIGSEFIANDNMDKTKKIRCCVTEINIQKSESNNPAIENKFNYIIVIIYYDIQEFQAID